MNERTRKAPMPRFTSTTALEDYAYQLRVRVFNSQRAAANYFGVHSSTISRYEQDRQLGSDSVVPPIGYLAELLRMSVESLEVSSQSSEEVAEYQAAGIADLGRVLQAFPVEYKYMESFQTWPQLCVAAASFLREHTGRQPGGPVLALQGLGRGSKGLAGAVALTGSATLGRAEGDAPQASTRWPLGIPNDIYYELPGREKSISDLLISLEITNIPSIVVVDGLGGLGKTSCAVEICRRALARGMFYGLLGDSARISAFADGKIVGVRSAALTFETLLNTLAGQLGLWELVTLGQDEKRDRIAHELVERPYLVLVDNIETAENADALVIWLRQLLNATTTSSVPRSRGVITSRSKVQHDGTLPLSLSGLDYEDTRIFLQSEAKARGADAILNADEAMLEWIRSRTGGAPLALKLITALAKTSNLVAALNALEGADEDLYHYLFRHSWQKLGEEARLVLMYIGTTVVTTVSWEELEGSGLAEETALVRATNQLVNESLLDASYIGGELRYSMHQLTRNFVLRDLPSIWHYT